jgi:hypothetical protein
VTLKTLGEKFTILNIIFQQNGYIKNGISQALHLKQKPKLKDEKPTSTAILPYQKAITNKISIKTVHIPRKKNMQMLRPVKDDLGLKLPGVYQIPCECGKVCVGQTGRSIKARCKEHMRHVRLKQPDKYAVAEHNFLQGITLTLVVPLCWTRQQVIWTAS